MKHYPPCELSVLGRPIVLGIDEDEMRTYLWGRLRARLRGMDNQLIAPDRAKQRLAEEVGVTPAQLSDFLRRGRGVDLMAEKMGYRRVSRFERID